MVASHDAKIDMAQRATTAIREDWMRCFEDVMLENCDQSRSTLLESDRNRSSMFSEKFDLPILWGNVWFGKNAR